MDKYLYKMYDINKNVVLEFESIYINCFDLLWILQENQDFISFSREKIRG